MSVKSCRSINHRGTHKHRNKHRRGGTSPLNPRHVASPASTTQKHHKKDNMNLMKEVLKHNTRKRTGLLSPRKTRKSPPRRKTPVKRNFIVSEETITEEEPEEKGRRKSF